MLEAIRSLHQHGAGQEVRTGGRSSIFGNQERHHAGIGTDHGGARSSDTDQGRYTHAHRAGAEFAVFKRNGRRADSRDGESMAQDLYFVAGAGGTIEGGAEV